MSEVNNVLSYNHDDVEWHISMYLAIFIEIQRGSKLLYVPDDSWSPINVDTFPARGKLEELFRVAKGKGLIEKIEPSSQIDPVKYVEVICAWQHQLLNDMSKPNLVVYNRKAWRID